MDNAHNTNSESDIHQAKNECPDKKKNRKSDYIIYAAIIDSIFISVLVTEMVIEFITVFTTFAWDWSKTGSTVEM